MGKNTSVLNIYDAIQDYGFTSQDYFVHCLRFSQIADKLKGKNILEIGCGKHTNLLKAMCMMKHGPQFNFYMGTDYGDIRPWRQDNELIDNKTCLIPHNDFCDKECFRELCYVIDKIYGKEQFTVVCFEVLEHMDFDSQCVFIYNLADLLNKYGVECYFSTPNFNGNAAKNHICEVSSELLSEMFDSVGLLWKTRVGLSCYKKYFKQELLVNSNDFELLNRLQYVLPVELIKMLWGASIDPKYSNNIMWHLACPFLQGTIDKTKLEHINDKQ